MKIELDINNYLSEDDKKEIAIDVFREQIRTELFKSNKGTVQSDSEIQRVIGNITHEIVFDEVQKYIPDARDLIKNNVKKALKKPLDYHVFTKKDLWDKEESLAITYIKEEVKSNEDLFKKRIKDTISNYPLDGLINDKVSSKFDEMASNMYDLSNLFSNK